MTAYLIVMTAILGQGPDAADQMPTFVYKYYGRDNEIKQVEGRETGVPKKRDPNSKSIMTIRPDRPWEGKAETVSVPVSQLLPGEQGVREETPAEREKRITREFESRGFTLIGDYWDPKGWVLKEDLGFAERARDMTLALDAKQKQAEESAQAQFAADGENAATDEGAGVLGWRLAQVGLGAAALVLVGLIAKFLFY